MATKKTTGIKTLSVPEKVVTIRKRAQAVYVPFEGNPSYAIRFNSNHNRFEETESLCSHTPQWSEISWSGWNGEPDTSADRVKHLRNLIKLIQETK